MLLYLFVTFCAGIMTEAPKRNSTRERRPNRFLQLDDPDPPNHSTSRLPDSRDPRSAPEATQLARLLLRFVANANKKFREQPDRDQLDDSSPQARPAEGQRVPTAPSKGTDRRPAGEPGTQTQGKRGQDARRPTQEDTPKSGTKPSDRKNSTSRTPAPTPADPDLAAPRGKQPSSETQGSGVGQASGRSWGKGEGKQRKKKGAGGLQRGGQREELKPFKRQSYHVAIAYHIYLKQARPGEEGSPARVDPTFHARRLRDMQERQP